VRYLWYVASLEETRNAYNIFLGKSEGKGPFGSHKFTWEYNIKMNLREI
jgi:hypothetical protein